MTTIRSAYLESADFKLFVDTPGIKPEQKVAPPRVDSEVVDASVFGFTVVASY